MNTAAFLQLGSFGERSRPCFRTSTEARARKESLYLDRKITPGSHPSRIPPVIALERPEVTHESQPTHTCLAPVACFVGLSWAEHNDNSEPCEACEGREIKRANPVCYRAPLKVQIGALKRARRRWSQ